jgi:hypothetical protein
LIERAKDWIRIPPKERYKLPPTHFEEMAARAQNAMDNIGAIYGLGTTAQASTAMTYGGASTNVNTANFYINNAGTLTQPFFGPIQGYNATLA